MERGRKIALLQFWVCEVARANCKCAICAVGFLHDTQLVYILSFIPIRSPNWKAMLRFW